RCIIIVVMGEYSDSYYGLFTIWITTLFCGLLICRETSSGDNAIISFEFFLSISNVFLTTAVRFSDFVQFMIAIGMLFDVTFEF
ncbi:hypothetical protein, partial [Psychroflexus sp. MES1-P1E]|uniref:hypothetical protein n=1 Tax=Psychroflexus sp. MES1-P1E TaxID=2058320 RepID=UPI001C60DF5F